MSTPSSLQRWREKNREHYNAYMRGANKKHRKGLRERVVALLGSQCALCGADDVRVLDLDHVNGGGTKLRKQSNDGSRPSYRECLKDRSGYRLLCKNCNWLEYLEG